VYSCQKYSADLVKPSVQSVITGRGAGGDICRGLPSTSATRSNEKEDEEETNICQTKENGLKMYGRLLGTLELFDDAGGGFVHLE
jgi:hypothetical protein